MSRRPHQSVHVPDKTPSMLQTLTLLGREPPPPHRPPEEGPGCTYVRLRRRGEINLKRARGAVRGAEAALAAQPSSSFTMSKVSPPPPRSSAEEVKGNGKHAVGGSGPPGWEKLQIPACVTRQSAVKAEKSGPPASRPRRFTKTSHLFPSFFPLIYSALVRQRFFFFFFCKGAQAPARRETRELEFSVQRPDNPNVISRD